MYLKRLYLRNFRNHKEKAIMLCPQLNVIWGPNAQGKTSIIEAVHLLTIGRSFRTSHQKELIRHDTEGFVVDAHFVKNGIEQRLMYSSNGSERKILYNHTSCASISNLIGIFPSVVIAPDDDLIKGPPHSRRQFLDIHLSQTDPVYFHHLSRYIRALKQRNHMLKSRKIDGIEAWEKALAHAAEYIVQARYRAFEEFSIKSNEIHHALCKEEPPLTLSYATKSPNMHIEAYYQSEYLKQRNREIAYGNTTVGPHRDDMKLSIGTAEARTFGSEGQKRTCVAIMRLAAWHRLKTFAEEPPILLIDDLGANLDATRRQCLLSYTQNLGQVLVTSTAEPQAQKNIHTIKLAS